MNKKVIAILLSVVMLISASPVVAAEEATVRPTIEEILNEYHQKSFEAQQAEEQGTAATYSRRSGSDSKTLEQETVDTLNAAGYEAYNVTAENYDSLEAELQSDFASMGLDPNGSYIVVISGEDNSGSSNPNSRLGSFPEQDIIDDGSAAPRRFEYTYNGVTYTMRYATVTAATNSSLFTSFSYGFKHSDHSEIWDEILDASLYYAMDKISKSGVFGTIVSLLTDITNDSNLKLLESGELTIIGSCLWTVQYIQVYDDRAKKWYEGQLSEYVTSKAKCTGYLYNSATNSADEYEGIETEFTTHSPHYYNTTQQKIDAVSGFLAIKGGYGGTVQDFTDTVDFYLLDSSNHLIGNGEGDPLFTVEHWFYR